MADRGDTHYHVPHLTLWFAGSSLLLLVSCVWMVLDDWNKPWKRHQREFREIEVARAEEFMAREESRLALEEEKHITAELAQKREIEGRSAELEAARKELVLLQATQFVATEAEKKAKQEYNWERFLVEEERLHSGDPEAGAERIANREADLNERAGEKESADFAVLAKEKEIAGFEQAITEAEARLKAATKGIELVRAKLAQLAPSDAPTIVANVIRDFPGLDFIGPNMKVQKQVLEHLTFELNFTKKKRIDMCMTCHVSIEREGFTAETIPDAEDGTARGVHPYLSHPRPDLYLSAKSPHPMTQIGCTICHRGAGEALDFVRADHRPSNEAEAKEWYAESHWHKQHHWDYPMLSSETIEAGCVQCHKTSMELIAEDAPKVSEGYQLVERYGCYACHKIEWFPTKRRPGPSLKGIRQKTTEEFVSAWVTNPKSFRPTTWMPQIFHLENYAPAETIVKSAWGEGREILGQEWNDSAVAAVQAFVWSRASTEELAPIPTEGDATRGREVFTLSGCLACHNVAGFTAEERATAEENKDWAAMPRDTNEHGPNLRGVATKVSPEWLFAWIKDPASYWSETRMPNLRLSDQDAADIVAYVFGDPIFQDVPDGWAIAKSPYARDVLEEQARWFFNRVGRAELQRRFAEDWKDDSVLLAAVGEKFVLNQGCHSCHEIAGLEDAQGIGTELTNWASKTVDKLDFGFMPEILAEEQGWSHHELEEYKKYREGWLVQKLHEPRSYDRRKLKNPAEKLRMPSFGFTEEQTQAIATFVLGLVDDEVQQAKMEPTAEDLALDAGTRVLRQKNCGACHVIEPGSITFRDAQGAERSVRGRILAFDGDVIPPPHGTFQDAAARYLAFMREDDEGFELEEVSAQLWRAEPGLGDAGQTILIEDVASVRGTDPVGGAFVDLVTDYYVYSTDAEGNPRTGDPDAQGRIQDVDGQWRDRTSEPFDKLRWTYAPPVLVDEGVKLQRDWFYQFLISPYPLREQIRVRMPTFTFAEGEAGAVADSFAIRAAREWPARFARELLVGLAKSPAEAAEEMSSLGITGVGAAVVQGIVDGKVNETGAGLEKLLRYADAKGFAMAGPVDPAYEAISERSPAVLESLLGSEPEFYGQVHDLLLKGPNCLSCHSLAGGAPTNTDPIAWAPDLVHSRERLRPDWLREWLTDPSKLYPGTSMPANFPLSDTVWQDLYAKPSAAQIEAVLIWLMNLDRALLKN